MPRIADYWAKRAAGYCVECPEPSPLFARCEKCRLRRGREKQRHRRQSRGGQWTEDRPDRESIGIQRRKSPNALADEALADQSWAAVDALVSCYRQGRIRADAIDAEDLGRLRKAYLLRRWEDPETGERSREWYELAPTGRWAAVRLLEGRAAVQGEDAQLARETAAEATAVRGAYGHGQGHGDGHGAGDAGSGAGSGAAGGNPARERAAAAGGGAGG